MASRGLQDIELRGALEWERYGNSEEQHGGVSMALRFRGKKLCTAISL